MHSLRQVFRIGQLLSFLALFSIAGGHWLVLQSVAWARMWAAHPQAETVLRAAARTFDGKHPCEMCKKIRRGEAKEKKRAYVLQEQESFPRPAQTETLVPVPTDLLVFEPRNERFPRSHRFAPPTPPPQLV